MRAANLLIALSTMLRLLDTGEGAPDVEDALVDDELAILQAFLGRARRGGDDSALREDGRDRDPEGAS